MGKPMVPPVVYTLWGSAEDYKQDHVMKQIDVAADLGVEMFCCDQSWYPGGHDGGLGNWEVDTNRFPDGLEPVAQYVRSKGMGMGLYFDTGAYDDTQMVREHPEFFLGVDDPVKIKYFLNFARADACDYWLDLISRFVEQFDVRFIRADFGNYPIPRDGSSLSWDLFDPDDKIQFAHVQGKCRVWETLLKRPPKLMWELNAGGGNSIDLGSMRRHHCSWMSDMMQIHAARMMQLGTASFIPGNFTGSAIICGVKGLNETDAGLPDITLLSRMAGSFYVCGYIHTWSRDERDQARRWIAIYKNIRHLLVKDFYRLLPQPQSDQQWDAAQFCDGDREGIVFALRLGGPTAAQHLFLQDMDAGVNYTITDRGSGEIRETTGDVLGREGLTVKLQPRTAKLLSYSRQ